MQSKEVLKTVAQRSIGWQWVWFQAFAPLRVRGRAVIGFLCIARIVRSVKDA